MTDTAASSVAHQPKSKHLSLRAVVAIAALIELLSGLNDLPILLGDLNQIPGPGPGGWFIIAKIALQPVLALLALGCAALGRLPLALMAMAAIIFLTWANYLPSVIRHGPDLKGDVFVNAQLVFQIVVAPMIAIAVFILASRRQRLGIATFLAVLGVVAFAIGVGMYGF